MYGFFKNASKSYDETFFLSDKTACFGFAKKPKKKKTTQTPIWELTYLLKNPL